MISMNSLLLDSRTEGDPSLAAKIHDCTRELMEATNAIETQAKASVDKVKAVVDANACKVEAAKRNVYDQRKKQLDTAVASANEEGKLLESQSGDLSTALSELESTRADLRQSETTKTDLTKELTELASTRDLEKKICGMKKSVVDDYVDAVDAAVAVYQTQMGLSVSRDVNGDLALTFTRLDPRSHSRPFTLALHLDPESKLYSFVSSSPKADFQPLVNALNRTNNLKKFICRARKTFADNLKH